ncbi:hypothetical protein [Mesorhizobium sp. YR577]|uniref:hypothetical protein n=1 Tax=Mesorhizobium sp. YR577 TaxID=1884373 RepID=UPI0008E9A316|nr:hypothetical protein [Mesorhizobium sp. YR577]SFT58794.1 hypothetical protein SAMN05518861_102366 [Mesorhizobium sp. YR577]
MARRKKILVRVAVSVVGLLALGTVAFAALVHHTLYDARLWFDACRVAGVSPEFYEHVEREARQALRVEGRVYEPSLATDLTVWFESQAGKMGTESEKLALMDATFRAVPMQYIGAFRSVGPVGPASRTEMHETITYGFAYRGSRGFQSRLLSYATYRISWLTDDAGNLGAFNSVSDRYSTAMFDRALKRARNDNQPLCPQSSRQIATRNS